VKASLPFQRSRRNIVSLLDFAIQKHDHAPREECVKQPDLFASQFEETAAKGSRLGAPEPIALLLE
jgi:hypothetical protein